MVKQNTLRVCIPYFTEIQQSYNGKHIEPINVQEINLLQSRDLRHRQNNKTKYFILFGDHVMFYNGVRPRGLIKEDRRREAGPSPRNQGKSDSPWSGSSGGVVRSIEGC